MLHFPPKHSRWGVRWTPRRQTSPTSPSHSQPNPFAVTTRWRWQKAPAIAQCNENIIYLQRIQQKKFHHTGALNALVVSLFLTFATRACGWLVTFRQSNCTTSCDCPVVTTEQLFPRAITLYSKAGQATPERLFSRQNFFFLLNYFPSCTAQVPRSDRRNTYSRT